MTPLELIEETKNYYSKDVKRRAVDSEGHYAYLGEGSRMCAVGRLLKPSKLLEVAKYHSDEISINALFDNKILNINDFQKKYREAIEKTREPVYFLRELQSLHDNDCNWDADGLTNDSGMHDYHKLVREFKYEY